MEEPLTPEQKPEEHITIKKSRLVWGLVAAAVLVVGIMVFKPSGNEEAATKKAVFKRDEPAKEQILQRDFKEKIYEMLDSGMSIGTISRETGVRRDVVRKIKKDREN